MKLTYGWLPQRPELPWDFSGISISPDTRTRKEEYAFALEAVREVADRSLSILDAAAGYKLGWHMLPYILAADGHSVHAVDIDCRSLKMPQHELITRELVDITNADTIASGSFDISLCISAIEHINLDERGRVYTELVRVTKRRVIFTADEAFWLAPDLLRIAEASNVHLDVVRVPMKGDHLQPKVMWGILDLC